MKSSPVWVSECVRSHRELQGSIRNNCFISSNECHEREDFIKAQFIIRFIYLSKKYIYMDKKITKEMTFGEILKLCPDSAEILFSYGLHCIGCHIAVVETLEQGCKAHGLSDEDIDAIVNKINALLGNKDDAQEVFEDDFED